MSEQSYKPCKELEICDELIKKYFNTQQYPNVTPRLMEEAEKLLGTAEVSARQAVQL